MSASTTSEIKTIGDTNARITLRLIKNLSYTHPGLRCASSRLLATCYKRHLLVCAGPRCTENGEAQALFETLGEKFKAAGIDKGELRVKRTRTHCFATCKSGPIMCVQPDGVWYYNVNEANLQRIINQHLVGGEPVEELIYHRGPVTD